MGTVETCGVVEYVRVPMTEPHRPRVKYVIGPDGSPLTIADLPAPGTKRWVIRRKAEVVAAVRGGLLSLEEACSRYTLPTYVSDFVATSEGLSLIKAFGVIKRSNLRRAV